MKKINFTKMVASGNDFALVDCRHNLKLTNYSLLARRMCDRKFGIGADGLLILDKSKIANLRMRIFNADGSEAEMCGNGARCTAKFAGAKVRRLQTKAGIIRTKIIGDKISIKLTDPLGIRLDIPVMVNGRVIKVNFINTGVPHAVIFTVGLEKMQVPIIGRLIRNHKQFAPKGTNVNFVEVLSKNAIKIRTYERGVEDETLACGTGSVASAIIFALKSGAKDKVLVHTRGGEVLKVYFKRESLDFSEAWLEGKAQIVYKGVYYV